MPHVHAWHLPHSKHRKMSPALSFSPLPALAPVTEVETTLPQGVVGPAQQWRGTPSGLVGEQSCCNLVQHPTKLSGSACCQ